MPSTLVVTLPVRLAWALHQLQVCSAFQQLRLALRFTIFYTRRFSNSMA
jgi:hypothetical protein